MNNYPSFLEYMNTRGKVGKKPKKTTSGDQVDVPEPKAKEDPYKKNKTKDKQPQVNEYLNSQGKLTQPVVDAKADYTGPDPHSPPGDKTPYRAKNSNGSSQKKEHGLGDMGGEQLKYQPNTKPKEKTVPSWPKTEQFLQKTKGMSISEFADFMLKECGCGHVGFDDNEEGLPSITAYTTGKIQPHPPEAVRYVVVLANKNDNLLDSMVHEMKGQGGLGKLVKAILNHPEAYDELTNLLGDEEEGPSRCKALARSMNGNYAKFIMDQESLYESVAPPIGLQNLRDDEENEDEDEYGLDDLNDLEDDEDFEDEDDLEDLGFKGDEEEPNPFGPEDELNGDVEAHDDEMDGEELESKPPKKRKLKKKFPHNNLLDAMKDYGPLKDAMKSI